MELETKDHTMKSGGLGTTIKYTMDTSGVIFDTLFQKLYSRPVDSIVREIYTNAMEVSPPGQPPHLHVPSSINPIFYIRDFGPGLSLKQMAEIYTVAGASTKRTSNEFIGAFGLGAKSPFAYADSYTVISWNGGMRTTYLVHRDSNRIPAMSVVSESPCGTETGLQVQLGVRLADLLTWINAVDTELWGMPIQPKLLNTTRQIKQLPARTHTVGPVSLIQSNVSLLRMGGPTYPLRLPAGLPNGVSSAPLFIDAPIGSVELTPSREALVYSDKTNNYIKSVVTAFIDHHRKDIDAKFAACKNYYEACELYYSLVPENSWASPSTSNLAKLSSLPPAMAKMLIPRSWQGQQLTYRLSLKEIYGEASLSRQQQYLDKFCTNGGSPSIYKLLRSPSGVRYSRPKHGRNMPILSTVNRTTKIYFVDMAEDYWHAKLQQQSPTMDDCVLGVENVAAADLDDLLTVLRKNWPNVVDMRTVKYIRPSRVKVTNAGTPAPKTKSYRFKVAKFYYNYVASSGQTAESTDTGYYIYTRNNLSYMDPVASPGARRFPHTPFYTLFSEKYDGTPNIPTIIKITKDEEKRFAKVQATLPSNWRPLSDLYLELLQDEYDALNAASPTEGERLYNTHTGMPGLYPNYIHPKFVTCFNKFYNRLSALGKYTSKFKSSTLTTSNHPYSMADLLKLCSEMNFTPTKAKAATTPQPKEVQDFMDFMTTSDYTDSIAYMKCYSNAVVLNKIEEFVKLIEGKP